MKIRYIYNDISSVNAVYKSLNKSDRIKINGGKGLGDDKDYLHDPEGDFATKYVKSGDAAFICTALIDNEPAGFIELERHWDKDHYTTKSEAAIAVNPKYRGQGIASKLVKKALEYVKSDDRYNTIEWYSATNNYASSALAVRSGFKFTDQITSRDKHTKLNLYIWKKYLHI